MAPPANLDLPPRPGPVRTHPPPSRHVFPSVIPLRLAVLPPGRPRLHLFVCINVSENA